MIHAPRFPRRRLLRAAFAAGGAVAAGHPVAAQDLGSPYGDLRQVTLRGRLVNLQDELPRKYGVRGLAAAPAQWALATPEGHYYMLVDGEVARRLLQSAPDRRAVEVTARLIPRSGLLEVLSFKEVDPETLRRRFHCAVCDISTEDFGPCACCGREMELVKPK